MLRLLSVAIGNRSEDVQARLAALLREAWGVFDDPWIQDKIISMQLVAPAVSDGQRDELQRQSVELWREEASSVSGMRRRFFLDRALDRARAYQLVDLDCEIRQEIQEAEIDQDEMHTVSSEIELRASYVENTLAHVSSAVGWSRCLKRLMVLGLPNR